MPGGNWLVRGTAAGGIEVLEAADAKDGPPAMAGWFASPFGVVGALLTAPSQLES